MFQHRLHENGHTLQVLRDLTRIEVIKAITTKGRKLTEKNIIMEKLIYENTFS